MKIKWSKKHIFIHFNRKKCLPDAPDGDLDEVIHMGLI